MGFLPVATFAALLGVATILHWDRFNHQHIAFLAWAGLYITTPFIVLLGWWRNRPEDSTQITPSAASLALPVRLLISIVFAVPLLISAALFLAPERTLGYWPWLLSPLTARVMAALFSLPGVVGLGSPWTHAGATPRIIWQSQAFPIVLILIAAFRAWVEFGEPGIAARLFVGGLGAMPVAIFGL